MTNSRRESYGDDETHRVLLVDLLTGGHHYEYASEVCGRLRNRGHDVQFLGPEPTERYQQFFGSDTRFLFEADSGFVDRLDKEPYQARQTAVERLYDWVGDDYDIVHFLAADTLLEPLLREYDGQSVPRFVLSLNGSFFRHVPFRDAPLTVVSNWLFETVGGHRYPARNNLPTLNKILADGPAEHITAPTETAKEQLEAAFDRRLSNRVTLAPDPAVPWNGRLPERDAAREILNLPLDQNIVLYFGQMRAEKGVDLLVDALQQYSGDPITAVLAGSPTDVDEDLLRSINREGVESVVHDEFIPQERLPAYFSAADTVVFPYRESFGRARPSGVFQKACAARRPVIVPDFGVFRRATIEYDLGARFDPGDSESIAEQIAAVVNDSESIAETAAFEEYSRVHSYNHLVRQFEQVYDRIKSTRE